MPILGRGRPNRHRTAPTIWGPVGLAEYPTLQPAAARASQTTTTGAALTSTAFIPPDNSLVVALLGSQLIVNSATPATLLVSDSSGGGNWTIVTHAEWSSGSHYSQTAIAVKYFAASPGPITVSGGRSGTTSVDLQLAVRVLAGAKSSQAGAGVFSQYKTATANAGQNAITTTGAGSQVYVVAAEDGNDPQTVNAATTTIDLWQNATDNAVNAIGMAKALTGAPGSQGPYGWTGSQSGNDMAISLLEILAAPAPGATTTYTKTGGSAGGSGVGGAKQVVSPVGATFVEDVNAVVGTTTTTVTNFVAAPSDGDIAYCYAVNKPSSVTPPAPAGWTQISSVAVGTGVDGVGTGLVRITVWYQVISGPFTPPTVTNPGGSVIAAGIAYIRPGAAQAGTSTVDHAVTTAQDLVDDATWSLTGAADLGVIAQDLVLTVDGWSNNISAAASGGTLTGPGLTVGSSSELTDTQLNVGNRGQMVANLFWGITGQSTGAQTHVQTLNAAMTNRTGGTLFVRIRALGQPVSQTYTKAGGSGGAGAPGGAKTVVRAVVLVASYEVDINAANNNTLTTPAFTPATGELLIVKAGNGDVRGTFAVNPTDTQDLEWTRQQSFFSGTNQSAAQVNTARVRTATSMTVSLAMTGSPYYHSMVVERWAWAGLHPTTPSVAVPTTGTGAPSATVTTIGTESAITWVNADWVPANPSSRAYRSGATEDGLQYTAGIIAVYYAWQRASVNGAQTIGLSAPGGQTWSMVGVELLTKVSVTPSATAPSDVTGWAINTALALTGTDTDPDIDTRRWSIVSGPVGAGTTLARVAALNWTPDTAGSYVLRYEVANSGGTGSDDIAVQVVTVSTKTGTGVPQGAPGGAKTVTPATTTSKAGTGAAVGAPGGAKTVQTPVTSTKAGAGAAVGAPGGAKVRTNATTTAKTGTSAAVGAPGGAKAVQNPVTTAKAGTAAAVGAPGGAKAVQTSIATAKTGTGAAQGAPGGAKIRTTATTFTKAGTGAAVGAPGGGRVTQNPITSSKTGTAAAAGAPGGAKLVQNPVTTAKTGAAATAGAPGGAKSIVSAGAITKTGAGAAAGAPGGARTRTTARTGTAAAVGAPGGAKTLTSAAIVIKSGTAAAVGAPGGVKTIQSGNVIAKAGTAALAGTPGGARTIEHVKTGAAARGGAPGGVQTVQHPATVAKTGTAAAALVGSGTKLVQAAGAIVKAGTAAAAGAPGGARTLTHQKAGSGAASGAPGGGKLVQAAGAIVKAGTAAASGAPGGAKTVQLAAVVVKAGTAAATGTPGGGKSVVSPGAVQKSGAAAASAAPGGAKSTVHQKTGAAAATGAPGGTKTQITAAAIVKAGTAAAVGAAGGAQSIVHPATVTKAGSGVAAVAPGGAKAVAAATTYAKAGSGVAAGAAGGTRLVQAAGAIVKTGAAAAAGAPAGARVRVLGRTGTAAGSTTPGGAKIVQSAAAIVKAGGCARTGAPGGSRSSILIRLGTAAGTGAPGGTRSGTIGKTGSGVAGGAPGGQKVFAPHTVTVKAGSGVASVVPTGVRVRLLPRTGGGAGNPVAGGIGYVNPRRRAGTAAARGAPGGAALVHEFIQFGRIQAWEQPSPAAAVLVTVGPAAAAEDGSVPVARGSASQPGTAAAVGETDRVPAAVWWDGVNA